MESYDRTSSAKDLYLKVHDLEIENSNKIKSGIVFKIDYNSKIEVSGDIDFNFKKNKIRWFLDAKEQDKVASKDEKSNLADRLSSFENLTYTPNNISMMPVTGGLNNIKQTHCMDRLDAFVYLLSLYYKGEKGLILNAGTSNTGFITNKKELEKYLDSFIGIKTYCKEIYHIDDELVCKLISSGREILDSVKKIEVYLDLADEFWKQKEKFYTKNDTNIEVRKQYEYMSERKKEITNEIEN